MPSHRPRLFVDGSWPVGLPKEPDEPITALGLLQAHGPRAGPPMRNPPPPPVRLAPAALSRVGDPSVARRRRTRDRPARAGRTSRATEETSETSSCDRRSRAIMSAESGILRRREVETLTGLSKPTIRLQAAARWTFPRPIRWASGLSAGGPSRSTSGLRAASGRVSAGE